MGFFGNILGKKARDYTASTKSGNFKVNEAMVLQKNNEWGVVPGSTAAAAFSSVAAADSAAAQSLITAGTHWFKFSANHTAAQYYYKPLTWSSSGSANKGGVLVWKASHNTVPTVNELGENIPFDYIVVGRMSGSATGVFGYSGEVEAGSTELFNSNTSGFTGTARNYWADGGVNMNGSKVMLGGGGAHGIYNTNQSACSWGQAAGSVGAGFDGSCGSYPNGLKLGLGNGGSPYYSSLSGTFEYWIYNS